MSKELNIFDDLIRKIREEASTLYSSEGGRLWAISHLTWVKDKKVYKDIVCLAKNICGTPIAIISIISKDKQFFKAKEGILVSSTPRSDSFCAHTLKFKSDDVLIVPDALLDVRFANNKLVVGPPYIRFYCGLPLIKNGVNLGAVCVIDTEPRTLSDSQREALAVLRNHLSEWLHVPKLTWWKKIWFGFFNKSDGTACEP
jgi:GAF domain-containing protein